MESSEVGSDKEKSLPTTVINLSRDSPEQMHSESDGYLESSSKYEEILGPLTLRENHASCCDYSMCHLREGCDQDNDYLFSNYDLGCN